MASQAREAKRSGWRRWGGCLGVVLVVVVLAYACDRVFTIYGDNWQNVRVVGAVVDEAGEPLPGARFLLVVDPNHHRWHLGISAVGKTRGGDVQGLTYDEDAPECVKLCAQAVTVDADEAGRIDVVLRIHRGGRFSLFRHGGPLPAFGGIHLVIVEAKGRPPLCGHPRTWKYEAYEASIYEIGAKLDLGRIVSR